MARDGHECAYCGSKPFEVCSLSCKFTSARPLPTQSVKGGTTSPGDFYDLYKKVAGPMLKALGSVDSEEAQRDEVAKHG